MIKMNRNIETLGVCSAPLAILGTGHPALANWFDSARLSNQKGLFMG